MAAGEADRIRPPKRPDRGLHDTRQRVAITGVNNRDARLVLDARVAELRDEQPEALRAQRLLEAYQLAIWRARSLTGFDALAVDLVGLPRDEARRLARAGAEAARQPLSTLPDRQVALWLRTEAALREHTGTGSVRLQGSGDEARLELRVPVEPTGQGVSALAGVGRQAAGLGRHLGRAPQQTDGQTPRAHPDAPPEGDAGHEGRGPRKAAGPRAPRAPQRGPRPMEGQEREPRQARHPRGRRPPGRKRDK